MTKFLLADDDPLTLAGIELLMAGSNYKVVAKATNGQALLDQLAAARPELIVMDFDMPGQNGLEVLRILRERGDKRPIVMLTGRIGDKRAFEALQLGLTGLVIKAAAPVDLLICLDAVVQGRRWIDHGVLQRAMEISLAPAGAEADPLGSLSKRERAVLGLVLQGLRNREIAAQLGIGEGTVKVHLHNMFEKLEVGSRTELAIKAARAPDI